MESEKEIIHRIFFSPVKMGRTFWVVLLLVCSLSAGAFSFYKAVKKVGKSFPGFFVGANLMVSVGQRSTWPGIEAGLKPLDKIISVNGRIVRDIEHYREVVSEGKPGDPFHYLVERNGVRYKFTVPIKRISALDFIISFLAPFSIGIVFLIFGAVTVFYLPDQRVSYVYFILCSLIGLFCLVFYESFTSHTFFRVAQIYPFIAAVSVHLFCIFPETKPVSDKKYYLASFVYGVSLVIVFLRQYYLFDQDASIVLSKASSFFVGIALLIDLVLLVGAHLKAPTRLARGKTKVLIAGLVIASSAVGLWSLNFIFKTASFYLDEAILISLVFPVFMTYAILKKNIFDMDHVIRVSITYVACGMLVLLFYLVIVAMAGFIWPDLLEPKRLVGVFTFLAILGAAIFKPLTRKVRLLTYKLLFRSQYDRLQTLMGYGKSLSSAVDMQEISKLLVSDLVLLMGLKGAFLVTYLGKDPHAPYMELETGVKEADSALPFLVRDESHILKLLIRETRPQFLGEIKTQKTAREVDKLKSLGVRIVVPVIAKGELLGALFLLDKISMDIFAIEDVEFLEALANQAAVSLENARLYLEKAKQERLAAIGQVASVIIHEIKNPLGVIKVSSGAIKKRFKEGEHGFELAGFIEKEVDRMNSTIQQILSFAKPKDSRMSVCSVREFIEDAVREVERSSDATRVLFRPELPSAELKINADSEKIRRALVNLLLNAKQASVEGGEVTVRVSPVMGNRSSEFPETVEISVEDRGEGIGEEQMKNIFQPFYTTKQEGTGLGLAIVSQIARDHGGDVVVKSVRGEGSVFTMRLPLKI